MIELRQIHIKVRPSKFGLVPFVIQDLVTVVRGGCWNSQGNSRNQPSPNFLPSLLQPVELTCLRGTTSAWPSVTGKASGNAMACSFSIQMRSGLMLQKGHVVSNPEG